MDTYATLKDLSARVQALEVDTPEGQAPQLAEAHEAIVGLDARIQDLEDDGGLAELRAQFEVLDRRLDAHMANLDEIAERLEGIFAGEGED